MNHLDQADACMGKPVTPRFCLRQPSADEAPSSGDQLRLVDALDQNHRLLLRTEDRAGGLRWTGYLCRLVVAGSSREAVALRHITVEEQIRPNERLSPYEEARNAGVVTGFIRCVIRKAMLAALEGTPGRYAAMLLSQESVTSQAILGLLQGREFAAQPRDLLFGPVHVSFQPEPFLEQLFLLPGLLSLEERVRHQCLCLLAEPLPRNVKRLLQVSPGSLLLSSFGLKGDELRLGDCWQADVP